MRRLFVLLPFIGLIALLIAACAPSLNWREVQPAGSHLALTFPCKPETAERVSQGQHQGLAQCETAGAHFALSWSELPDPLLAGAALKQMRESLATSLSADADAPRPFAVPGMTPSPEALVQNLSGTRSARVAVFARGTVVYQLLVLGKRVDEAAWQGLVSELKFAD